MHREQQDRRVGGIDLLVARRRGHRLRQCLGGDRDCGLHVLRGGIDVAIEIELYDDRGGAERALRRHLRDAGDLPELLLQRGGNRRRHGLGAGARPGRGDLNGGKSTCGSGATGRNGNETRPTNASAAINSVVATGRPMNGSEMLTSDRPASPRCAARRGDGSVDLQLVLAVGDDALALIKARRDDGAVAGRRAGLDRTRFDGVVRLHHPGEHAVRPALDRDRRYDHDVLARFEQNPGIDEFARP